MEEQPHLWKQILIQQLSQRYHTAQRLINERKLDEAKENYMDMLRIYQDISNTDLSMEDKRIANFCVKTIYDTLLEKQEEPPITESTFRVLFSISIIVLLVGLAIVLKPTIVGLVTYDSLEAPIFTGTQTRFFINGPFTLDLAKLFQSADGNDLDYLVTRSPTVDIDMSGSIARFLPSGKKGLSRHTLIAISKSGNTYEVTRAPIEIIVQ